MIKAARPGESTPKIEKRTEDNKKYTLDCTNILEATELVYGTIDYTSPTVLKFSDIRVRQGKSIEFRLTGGPTGGQFTEYPVSFFIKTTLGNVLKVPILVKAFT